MGSSLTLGDKIRIARKSLKLTQEALAGSTFTKSFISQVEKNITRPSLKSLRVIAERLGKPVSYFLEEDSDVPPAPEHDQVDNLIALGQQLTRKSEWSAALDALRQALTFCPPHDPARRGRIHYHCSFALSKLHRYQESLASITHAISDFQLANAGWEEANACNVAAAICAEDLGERAKAVEHLERALFVIDGEKLDDPYLLIRVLVNLGINCAHLDRLDEVVAYCDRALDLMKTKGDFFKYGEICHTLGYVYEHRGEIDKAIESTERAFKFYEAIGDAAGQAQSLLNLAILYSQTGELKTAEQRFQEAADRAISLDGATKASLFPRVLLEFADFDLSQGHYRAALQKLQQARQATPGKGIMLEIHRKQARVHELLGDLSEAIMELQSALTLLSGKEDKGLVVADICSDLGRLYGVTGDMARANEYLLRSVDLYRRQNQNHPSTSDHR